VDLYVTGADTDSVVAEGGSPRRGLGNLKIRPIGSSRLGHTVPLHLLPSNMSTYPGARLYSSSTSSSPPRSPDEQTAEGFQTDATPSPITTTSDGSESGFASLRGLFGEPRRSWSPPQASRHETDAIIDDAQSNKPDQEINSSNNFVDGDPFEDHPNNLFLNAEKEDAKAQAHEMLSSASATEEQSSAARTDQSAEQPINNTDASIMSNATSDNTNSFRPSPAVRIQRVASDDPFKTGSDNVIRKHFVLEGSDPHVEGANRLKEAPVQVRKASKGTKAPKPKPLPLWKVNSDDLKVQYRSNERVNPSVTPRQPAQAYNSPSTSQSLENVDQRPSDEGLSALSEIPADDPSSRSPSKPKADASSLTHLTSTGEAHMVDVGQKESTDRVAVAVGFVHFGNSKTCQLIKDNLNKKGDVLGVARIAGIMAAKRCSDIIPLCHPIPITKITLDVEAITTPNPSNVWFLKGGPVRRYGVVAVEARVHTRGQTGVEMEALTAVSGACLTVYDMCKAVDKDMVISGARVLYKAGGKSGVYLHEKFKDHPVNQKFIKRDLN
jgi:cyclic pyranopterin phosphate synthase